MVDTLRRLERVRDRARQLLVRVVGHPLLALVGRDGEKLLEVDRGWCAVFLGWLDCNRPARSDVQVEAHDRLVDAADLFDRECPVTEPLAIEDHQLREHMVEDAIGHTRDGWFLSSLASAFEEKVAVRIEEVALARRNAHAAMAAALVYEAEEGQQLSPRAVPLVHGRSEE